LRRRFWIVLNGELQRRAKGQFLAHVSHEIRTPMNGVLGMAELLLRGELTPQQREQVKLVQTSAESLLALVNDGLDLSRIEAERPDAQEAARRLARRGRSILVVDDRGVNRAVALGLLRELGFTAEAVESGEEALALLAERPFHAVLLDCEMPGLDGFETCRRWRAHEAAGRPRLPVIAVTAHTQPEEREACRAAGMDDYLAKPFRTPELAAVLDRWLSIEPAGDGLAERLAALRSLEETTGKPIVAVFLRQGEDDLATMRRALPQEDGQTVAEAAHGLAGSAGMLGATGLAEKAAEIATLARQGDLSACAERLPALEQAWRDTAARLQP
jgi:CheY-like chemotaxis protein